MEASSSILSHRGKGVKLTLFFLVLILTYLVIGKARALTIGDKAPNFTAQSTKGELQFYTLFSGKYVLLFSHPQDFTPVCLTELAEVQKLVSTLRKHKTIPVGLSVDSLDRHHRWEKDILKLAGESKDSLDYPIIADEQLQVAKLYGMLGDDELPDAGRTPKDNKTARTVFLIGPDHRIRMTLTYPMTTGRNFTEIVRVVKSIQLNDKAGVATPADWTDGQDVVVSPGMSDQDARAKYGEIKTPVLPSKAQGQKDYLRFVKQPGG